MSAMSNPNTLFQIKMTEMVYDEECDTGGVKEEFVEKDPLILSY